MARQALTTCALASALTIIIRTNLWRVRWKSRVDFSRYVFTWHMHRSNIHQAKRRRYCLGQNGLRCTILVVKTSAPLHHRLVHTVLNASALDYNADIYEASPWASLLGLHHRHACFRIETVQGIRNHKQRMGRASERILSTASGQTTVPHVRTAFHLHYARILIHSDASNGPTL